MENQSFETFGILELFGHMIIAGKISEQTIGGQGFVRVDVPAIEGQKAYTKYYGAGAIYAITPTDEATAIAAANGLRAKPIETYKLNLQLPARSSHYDEDDDPDF